MFPIIILSYLPSVEVNIILKVTDFSDVIYTFYLPSFIRHSGNHTGREYTSLKSSQKNYGLLLVKISNRRSFSLDQNLPECCISRVIFEFRNLAKMLLNSSEKLLETPSLPLYQSLSFVGKRTMKILMKSRF